MEEKKQPFEHSEKLRDIIKWFAANVPCPGSEWNQLITAINTALTDLQQRNTEQAAGMEANCYTPDEIRAIEEAAYHAGKVGGYY